MQFKDLILPKRKEGYRKISRYTHSEKDMHDKAVLKTGRFPAPVLLSQSPSALKKSRALPKRIPGVIFMLNCLLLNCSISHGQQIGKVNAKIKHLASPVNIDGKVYIFAELEIFNQSASAIKVSSLKLTDGHQHLIWNTDGEELATLTNVGEVMVQPRKSRIFYLELPLPDKSKKGILNLSVVYNPHAGKNFPIKLSFKIPRSKSVKLMAPLKGDNWTAIWNPLWERGHRRVYYSQQGVARIPGRFAIDFVKLDSSGKLTAGSPETVSQYYSYGAEVIAVADGVIASMTNDFKESATISANADHAPQFASGNFLSIKIRDSVYAFYEHLFPGSIHLKVGDKVRAGQVVARVGFTGQASEPHLHFHLADRNSLLGAEGIPFVFKKFKQKGVFNDFTDLGKKRWKSYDGNSIKLNSRPVSNSVVDLH